MEAPFPGVRNAAISRITDKEMLSKLYSEEEAARDRVVELALNKEHRPGIGNINSYYIDMIRDEETFCKLLIQDPNDYAVYFYRNWESRVQCTQKGYMKIALNATGKHTRSHAAYRAFRNMDDTEKFKWVKDRKIAEDVRKEALDCIRDPKILASVAADNNMPLYFRSDALRKVKDQEILVNYARKRRYDVSMRVAALEHINDQEILERLAFSDDDIKVREAAVYRLNKGNPKLAVIRDTVPELKNAACSHIGHLWDNGYTVSHGNGGRDIIYTCRICGKTDRQPYEWSSADSV